MIIFPQNGRLGNQIFQYHGLKKYYPDHRIVFLGCDSLNSILSDLNAAFIDTKHLLPAFFHLNLTKFLFALARLRILGCIYEDISSESYRLCSRNGFIFNLYVSRNLFFQHNECIDDVIQAPLLKNSVIAEARSWFFSRGLDLNSDYLVFVHIRRGDYLSWPSVDSPAALPLSWYLRAIDLIRSAFPDSIFVLMSDDVMYLEDIFGSSPNFHISRNTPQVDFALMSLCNSGILSASSFAWWGAFYSRIANSCDSLFVAPEYWCGHKTKSWYPSNFKAEWITYLN